MMKKLFLAFLALFLLASPAGAQQWNHSDWTDGSVPARDWANYTLAPPTGSAPADTFEPADVADSGFTESDWIQTLDGTGWGINSPKFRINCKPSKFFYGDPILAYGTPPPVVHKHQGIGNWNWDQNSTWTTLRASPGSSCGGGPLNGTLYWEPEVIKKLPSGLQVGIKPDVIDFYYVDLVGGGMTWLRRDLAFILGTNPLDYNDTARRAEYAAQGYVYPGGPETPAGFQGWQCINDNLAPVTVSDQSAMRSPYIDPQTGDYIKLEYARHLRAPDGSDPFQGTCTSGTLILNLSAPECWDGHNLRAPDGRGHFAHAARVNNQVACPSMMVNGVRQYYRKVPALGVKSEFRHSGFSDYGQWYFSSDRLNPASTPADTSSKDPCRRVGPWFCNGSTAHADWMGGWKTSIMDEWQLNCLAIPVRGATPPAQGNDCNDGRLSQFRKLKTGGPSPNSALTGGCTTILGCHDASVGGANRIRIPGAGEEGPFEGHGTHASARFGSLESALAALRGARSTPTTSRNRRSGLRVRR